MIEDPAAWPYERYRARLAAWAAVLDPAEAPRDDRLVPLEFQRRVARERLGLAVEEMPGGHVPVLARPGELAEWLAAGQ